MIDQKMHPAALQEIIRQIPAQGKESPAQLLNLKREVAKKYGLPTIPSNLQLLISLPKEKMEQYKKILLTKPTRTISGVTPVAIMTRPDRCPHGKCTFCPGGLNSPWGDVPQSYTGHEPATMRGIRNEYDSYLQVFNRLQQYLLLGQTIDKIELIVMGGTFPAAAPEYQEEFIRSAFQALNDFSDVFFDTGGFRYQFFKEFFEFPGEKNDPLREASIKEKIRQIKNRRKTTLEEEQIRNESRHSRAVALCIETKPDWGFLEQGNEMLRQGCTRVELGIESVYDDVLLHTHRGHTAADSKKSIQILRDLGLKINFHYMPGLPLTNRERDLAGMLQLFSDPDYRPDMIKIYPCMVAPGTALYHQWKQGTFTPLSTPEAASLIAEWKNKVPEYCRIQRIQRDVPTKYWEAGVDRTNFRQYLSENYSYSCRCIRCREPKGRSVSWEKVIITVKEYVACGGKEFFIAVEDPEQDILLGFCRLRFPGQFLRPEITAESALIRELHVYGTATALGEEGVIQHRGWGKQLMQKAEEIAAGQDRNKMVVMSGVGVREYYRKLGYQKEGPYMVKVLR